MVRILRNIFTKLNEFVGCLFSSCNDVFKLTEGRKPKIAFLTVKVKKAFLTEISLLQRTSKSHS